MRRLQKKLYRSKRLNVIQVSNQRDDEDGYYNNIDQYVTPGDESQALDDENGVRNQVPKEVGKHKTTSLPIVWTMPKGQIIVIKCNQESQLIGDEGAIGVIVWNKLATKHFNVLS